MAIRIKEILKTRGMTQQDLADKLGCTLQNVKNTLGSSSLTTANLEKYASALNVPMWELFASREEIIGEGNNKSIGICPHCGKPITIKIEIE